MSESSKKLMFYILERIDGHLEDGFPIYPGSLAHEEFKTCMEKVRELRECQE